MRKIDILSAMGGMLVGASIMYLLMCYLCSENYSAGWMSGCEYGVNRTHCIFGVGTDCELYEKTYPEKHNEIIWQH